MTDGTSTKWRVPMPALAAAALLAVGVASWMSYRHRPQEEAAASAPRMLATGVGVRDSVRLSDGTMVILGPLSSLTTAADFGTATRGIEVRGDAWLDVAHDGSKPFTVKAGNALITDIGTKFGVRTDTPEGVAVTVSEGVVSLRQVNAPTMQGIILRAGDNGLLGTDGPPTAQRGAANEDDIAWTRGRLVFHDAPLSEVMSSMRKWYGLDMRAPDRSLAGRHLTATFNGESADRVLEVIQLALGVEIERRGDTAIIRPAKASVRSR
jgi:transmembrane sensor